MGCYFQGGVIIQCLWYLHRVISVDYTTHTYTEMSRSGDYTMYHTYTYLSFDYIITHIPTLGFLLTIHHHTIDNRAQLSMIPHISLSN